MLGTFSYFLVSILCLNDIAYAIDLAHGYIYRY